MAERLGSDPKFRWEGQRSIDPGPPLPFSTVLRTAFLLACDVNKVRVRSGQALPVSEFDSFRRSSST